MKTKEHWETVYETKEDDAVSWYQPEATLSLQLIQAQPKGTISAVIDVGGGASRLVDGLLANGFEELTVLDVSARALGVAKARLGEQASRVQWLEADITKVNLPPEGYDLWHDRAVFHFLTEPGDRNAYVTLMERSLKDGGHAIFATFGIEGPTRCSGLEIVRYNSISLSAQIGSSFRLVHSQDETHQTPTGKQQHFTYSVFQKEKPSS